MNKIFAQNKKFLIIAAVFGLILIFTPLYSVKAVNIYQWCDCTISPSCWMRCLVETMLSIPIRLIFTVITGIFGIFALLAGLIYALTVAIVNWLLQIIMSVGVTPNNPLTPDIVKIGWETTRDLANMFFILALAFIGLATVLRIKEYEAKKALPMLIIVALLINFTPVIVGFVVDMGNIVTTFFLGLAGGVYSPNDIMAEAWDYLPEAMKLVWTTNGKFFTEMPRTIAILITVTVYGLCLLLFFAIGILIYILIGAVFFCRILILWVLMILSPIAFLSRVFPAGRTTKMIFPDILHWDKWWEKLIQWTVVGIPIGFFLWLSNSIMFFYKGDIEGKFGIDVMVASLQTASSYPYDASFAAEVAVHEAQLINLISMLLAPTIGLFLLIMGALISLKAVPEGARGIMRFTHERGSRGGRRGWQGITRGYAAAIRIPQNIRGQRAIGVSSGRAIRRALLDPLVQTWQGWRNRPTPGPAPAAGGGGGGPAAGGSGGAPAAQPVPPGHRARARRIARRVASGATVGAARLGWRAASGILSAANSMATQRIGGTLSANQQAAQKTCSNPVCRENIPANARFCQHCGDAQP